MRFGLSLQTDGRWSVVDQTTGTTAEDGSKTVDGLALQEAQIAADEMELTDLIARLQSGSLPLKK
ncbi:hypothetical protein [Aureimonas sp. AU40]|uniref:hypothetical protein n=1 Tax=Aureimonas sp. AU40 TaxID=1637747 RepID=UPI0012E3C264|nr:hypothetical protein [Aureimonas sp. AU40]